MERSTASPAPAPAPAPAAAEGTRAKAASPFMPIPQKSVSGIQGIPTNESYVATAARREGQHRSNQFQIHQEKTACRSVCRSVEQKTKSAFSQFSPDTTTPVWRRTSNERKEPSPVGDNPDDEDMREEGGLAALAIKFDSFIEEEEEVTAAVAAVAVAAVAVAVAATTHI